MINQYEVHATFLDTENQLQKKIIYHYLNCKCFDTSAGYIFFSFLANSTLRIIVRLFFLHFFQSSFPDG